MISKIIEYRHSKLIIAIIFAITSYYIFYSKLLLPNQIFNHFDAKIYYIPSRFYLYEKIYNEGIFPFWTERQYLGFPVYADIEMGYLHPLNVFLILLFGPILSYKINHLLFYLIGSISLYVFLKRNKIGIIGYFIANTIFFFNQFMNLHQIHFNIILTFYLFPLGILLVDYYLKTNKFKYILFQAPVISSGILFGHIQSVFIFLCGILVYFLVMVDTRNFIKESIKYFLLSGILVLILTLPQVLPTAEIFLNSQRNNSLNHKEGAFTPIMTSFIFLPNPFDINGDYNGESVRPDYLNFLGHEMYVYLGISSFLVFLIAFLNNKDMKIKIFVYTLLWFYIFFSTAGNNFLLKEETFLIDIFRYWQRFSVIFAFGLAIIVAKWVDDPIFLKFKEIKNNLILLFLPVLYLLFLEIYQTNTVTNKIINLIKLNTSENFLYFVYISINLILCTALITKNKLYLIQLAFVFLIFIDLFKYSYKNNNQIIGKFHEIFSYKNSTNFNSERVLDNNENTSGLEFLYKVSWSPFGFSNFMEKDYLIYLNKIGLNTRNDYITDKDSFLKQDLKEENLRKLGISRFIDSDQKEIKINYDGIDLVTNNLKVNYLQKNEGHIIFKYQSESQVELKTLIKYSPNWEVKINGQEVKYESDEIFLKFKAPAGENIVEIKYIPKPFYLGLQISGLLLLFYIGLIYFLKQKKYLK